MSMAPSKPAHVPMNQFAVQGGELLIGGVRASTLAAPSPPAPRTSASCAKTVRVPISTMGW